MFWTIVKGYIQIAVSLIISDILILSSHKLDHKFKLEKLKNMYKLITQYSQLSQQVCKY